MNESSGVKDADVQAMLGAFAKQWNEHLAPAWFLDAAQFTFVAKQDQGNVSA
jgi:hypothetical protein